MDNTIKKLVEIDRQASIKVNQARDMLDNIEQTNSLDKNALYNELMSTKENELTQVILEKKEEQVKIIKQLDEEYKIKFDELDELFNNKKSDLIKTVVERCIG